MKAKHQGTFYGSRFRLARMRRGLSIADMEARTGIDRGRLYRYQGDRQSPPKEHVEQIAQATGFPAPFFYMGEAPVLDPRNVSF